MRCIFPKPTLKYLSKLEQNFFDEFSEEIEIGIFRTLDHLYKFYDFTVLDQLVSNTKKLDLLIEKQLMIHVGDFSIKK